MSYSFSVRAADKEAAKAAVAESFDKVVENQPIHARDRAVALVAAGAVIDLLVEDTSKVISVGVSGYVSWRDELNEDASNELSGASFSVNASLVVQAIEPGA